MSVLVDGEIVLYGFVGENYWGDGFTSRDVLDALAELGREADVTVRINSGGGYVDDGIAIYTLLTAHKGQVTVIVDGIAASSASVIAMAGDSRIMPKGSMMMIHDPSGAVWGTAADMERYALVMDKYAENLAGIYADVTGDDADSIRDEMRAETWMTAQEAVDRGFATAMNDNQAKAVAAHDYRVYANAPKRLVALARKNNWSHEANRPNAVASATAQRQKELPMTDKKVADVASAEMDKVVADARAQATEETKARIQAITGLEEAKGRDGLATYLAFSTSMGVDEAKAALTASAKDAPVATPQTPAEQAAAYEQSRVAALTSPQGGGVQAKSGLSAAVDCQITAIKR